MNKPALNLKTSASEVIRLHQEILKSAQSTLGRAVTIGQILTTVKTSLKHGDWIPWCKLNLDGMGVQTAQRYMRCYENRTYLLAQNVKEASTAYKLLNSPSKPKPRPRSNTSPVTHLEISLENNGTPEPEQPENPVQEAEIIYRDELGYEIPECCVEFWQRKNEIQDLMTAVSRVKTAIEKGKAADDPLYFWVAQAAIDQLSRTYQFLTDAKPYAVCVYCQGTEVTRGKCRACGGTGLVSKYGYEQRTDEKLRKMRAKQIEEQRRK